MDKRIRFSTDPFLRPVAIGLSLWLVSAVALAEVESGSALSAIESDPESYPTIRSVQVETNNVFSDSLAAKSWVYRLINRLHIRTRTHVIDREILLKEGERYDADLAYETERTLRGLPYIYDAEVALDSSNTDSVVLRVRTIDKWSISGGVQVVRQPGRSRVDVGAKETNLLGIGQTVELKHIFSNPDPDYFVFGYFDPRLLGSFHRLEFRVNDNPFQRERRFAFARRFVRRQDRFAYEFTLSDFRERELKFNNGDTTLTFFQEGDRIKVGFVGRRGGSHDKL
ncbi:MAG: hypothetical protein ACE5GA_01965, partial [Candidatus Zixiibacteriota bacterium]